MELRDCQGSWRYSPCIWLFPFWVRWTHFADYQGSVWVSYQALWANFFLGITSSGFSFRRWIASCSSVWTSLAHICSLSISLRYSRFLSRCARHIWLFVMTPPRFHQEYPPFCVWFLHVLSDHRPIYQTSSAMILFCVLSLPLSALWTAAYYCCRSLSAASHIAPDSYATLGSPWATYRYYDSANISRYAGNQPFFSTIEARTKAPQVSRICR